MFSRRTLFQLLGIAGVVGASTKITEAKVPLHDVDEDVPLARVPVLKSEGSHFYTGRGVLEVEKSGDWKEVGEVETFEIFTEVERTCHGMIRTSIKARFSMLELNVGALSWADEELQGQFHLRLRSKKYEFDMPDVKGFSMVGDDWDIWEADLPLNGCVLISLSGV